MRKRRTHISADHDLEYGHPHHVDHISRDSIEAAEAEGWEEGDDNRGYHRMPVNVNEKTSIECYLKGISENTHSRFWGPLLRHT